MRDYSVQLEIEGFHALWSAPDTGDMSVSKPAPTWSQSERLFSNIADVQNARYLPLRAVICAPLRWKRFVCNYNGPRRHRVNMKEGNSEQVVAMVLVNVRYVIHATCVPYAPPMERVSEKGRAYFAPRQNGAHSLQAQFNRRLERGQCYHTLFLGWKEFTPTYVGPPRPDAKAQEDINMVIPCMLHRVMDQPKYGAFSPTFRQNVPIVKGVLEYA